MANLDSVFAHMFTDPKTEDGVICIALSLILYIYWPLSTAIFTLLLNLLTRNSRALWWRPTSCFTSRTCARVLAASASTFSGGATSSSPPPSRASRRLLLSLKSNLKQSLTCTFYEYKAAPTGLMRQIRKINVQYRTRLPSFAKGFGFTLRGECDFKLEDFWATGAAPEFFEPFYGTFMHH